MKFRSTGVFAFCLIMMVSNQAHGQKFIKYIFLENRVKILVQKNFIEAQMKDSLINSQLAKHEKCWKTKNNAATLNAFTFEHESASDILVVTHSFWNEFSDSEIFTIKKERKANINNKKQIAVIELSAKLKGKEKYSCIFCSSLENNEYIFFLFQCPEKRKNKYINGLNESIKTLFIQ